MSAFSVDTGQQTTPPLVDDVVHNGPLPDVRSMDPVLRDHFRKFSTPRLLHFLFGNSLINRVTPYFLDSQTFFYQYLVFFC